MDDAPISTPQRFADLGEGCFFDPHRVHRAEDGSLYSLEWTPTLNKKRAPWKDCMALVEKCALLGGGWSAPSPHELQGLVDYTKHEPATTAPDTKSDWYWTGQTEAWADDASSSGYAWVVYFGSGGVGYGDQYDDGFVRACRRVPARQA